MRTDLDTVMGERLAVFSMHNIRKTGRSLDALVGKAYLKNSRKIQKTGQSLVGQSFVHDCIKTRIPGEF